LPFPPRKGCIVPNLAHPTPRTPDSYPRSADAIPMEK
jgi:hypothetical protein